jgi:Cu2+-exporting ATPase
MTQDTTINPASGAAKNFDIFDSEDFQRSFTSSSSEGRRDSRILIEGITCYACDWLIRQALERHFAKSGNQEPPTITINQSTGAAILRWQPADTKLSAIVNFIDTLGYAMMPHRQTSASDQSSLIRVGVGLFIMMNVMSFALAEYFAGSEGLDPALAAFLRWISLILTTASLAYPGREFFTNTARSIKARAPNIDGPILIGLLAAYFWSLRSTLMGQGEVYFDSVCAVIALVMTGRLVQQNVLRRNQARMASLLNPRDGWVLVKRRQGDSELWEPARASSVEQGDIIRVLPGEMFPLKVTCATSCAEISFEQLKGETEWKAVNSGDEIPAGALNGSAPVEAVAAQNGSQSYTETLSRSIERAIHEKGLSQSWSDKAAWILFAVIFVVAAAVFTLVSRQNLAEAVSRVVAIMLVACPCTFAIGVPLAFGTSMTQALKAGILFKSQRAVESLARANSFVFDKTGTLTEGKVSVKHWHWLAGISAEERELILSVLSGIDQYSSHHVASAFSTYARSLGRDSSTRPEAIRPDSINERQGMGMELLTAHHSIRVGRPEFVAGHPVSTEDARSGTWISLNNKPAARVTLDDTTRGDAGTVIKSIQTNGDMVHVISGDSSARTQLTARSLHIEPRQTHGEATPGNKALLIRKIKSKQRVAMIGNGLNDAGAMAAADISIAVAGSSSTAMNSSDICLLNNDLSLVNLAVSCARDTMKRVRLVFGFAVFYNLVGLALAATGHVSPVVAAVLMPISSITITHIATWWHIHPRPRNAASVAATEA